MNFWHGNTLQGKLLVGIDGVLQRKRPGNGGLRISQYAGSEVSHLNVGSSGKGLLSVLRPERVWRAAHHKSEIRIPTQGPQALHAAPGVAAAFPPPRSCPQPPTCATSQAWIRLTCMFTQLAHLRMMATSRPGAPVAALHDAPAWPHCPSPRADTGPSSCTAPHACTALCTRPRMLSTARPGLPGPLQAPGNPVTCARAHWCSGTHQRTCSKLPTLRCQTTPLFPSTNARMCTCRTPSRSAGGWPAP